MKIRFIIESILFLCLLSACAERTLVPPLSESAYKVIAEDATGQLVRLYPPALTHLIVASEDIIGFDRQFKTQLRNCGYAIHENHENPDNLKQPGKHFSYFLDPLSGVSHYGYYRLTLIIDDAQLSRLYDANELNKPNYWSYRK